MRLEPPYAAARGRHESVELAVADVEALRALRLPHGIRAPRVVVRIELALAALSLRPRPEWAPLVSLSAELSLPGAETTLVFAAPVPVHAVVAELGRQAVWPDRVGWRGIVVAGEELRKVPADVDPARPGLAPGVADPTLAIGPLDERVHNPTGRAPTAGYLFRGADPRGVVENAMSGMAMTTSRPADPVTSFGPEAAGMLAEPIDLGELAVVYGPAVVAALSAPLDPSDPLSLEEHAVVLRRAAHATYSTHAWRRRLGELAGVRTHHQPAVSVVMATRRPELLAHALAQVARQRGVEQLELVLAPHGFSVSAAEVAALAPGLAVTLAPAPAETVFGDVLSGALARAAGDVVLKMDDDDWYGPDFVLDLLQARAWSGAELVGVPDDWHYLEPLDLTIRLGIPVEVYTGFVAGGSMLLDIGLLREVGGFRSVPRAVDAHLIGAVRAAGGAVYRTHGLGYLMRKTGAGHTWAEDLADLRARAVATYDGFRPSRLLETDRP